MADDNSPQPASEPIPRVSRQLSTARREWQWCAEIEAMSCYVPQDERLSPLVGGGCELTIADQVKGKLFKWGLTDLLSEMRRVALGEIDRCAPNVTLGPRQHIATFHFTLTRSGGQQLVVFFWIGLGDRGRSICMCLVFPRRGPSDDGPGRPLDSCDRPAFAHYQVTPSGRRRVRSAGQAAARGVFRYVAIRLRLRHLRRIAACEALRLSIDAGHRIFDPVSTLPERRVIKVGAIALSEGRTIWAALSDTVPPSILARRLLFAGSPELTRRALSWLTPLAAHPMACVESCDGFAVLAPDERLIMWLDHVRRYEAEVAPLVVQTLSRSGAAKAWDARGAGFLDDILAVQRDLALAAGQLWAIDWDSRVLISDPALTGPVVSFVPAAPPQLGANRDGLSDAFVCFPANRAALEGVLDGPGAANSEQQRPIGQALSSSVACVIQSPKSDLGSHTLQLLILARAKMLAAIAGFSLWADDANGS